MVCAVVAGRASGRGVSLVRWCLEHLFGTVGCLCQHSIQLSGVDPPARSPRRVERGVASGALAPGDALPSVRGAGRVAGRLPHDRRGRAGATCAGAASSSRARAAARASPSARRCARAARRSRRPARATSRRQRPTRALLPTLEAALRDLPAPHRLYGEPPVLGARGGRRRDVAAGTDSRRADLRRQRRARRHRAGARRAPLPGRRRRRRGPGLAGRDRPRARARAAARAGARSTRAGCGRTRWSGALRAGARAVVLTPRGQNPTGAAPRRRARGRAARGADRGRAARRGRPPRPGGRRRRGTRPPARRRATRPCSRSRSGSGPTCACAIVTGDELTLARVEGRQSLGPGWVSGISQRLTARLWARTDVDAARATPTSPAAKRMLAALAACRHRGARRQRAERVGAGARRGRRRARAARRGASRSRPARRSGWRRRRRCGSRRRRCKPDEAPAIAAALAAAVHPPRRTRAA